MKRIIKIWSQFDKKNKWRIKGPSIKIKEVLKFRDPINLIRGVIEEINSNFESIWPKLKEIKDQNRINIGIWEPYQFS